LSKKALLEKNTALCKVRIISDICVKNILGDGLMRIRVGSCHRGEKHRVEGILPPPPPAFKMGKLAGAAGCDSFYFSPRQL
jgi:hypothetical protein